jgi:polyprenyl-phospho-N-acetylgalactosaminyl synthase
MGLDSRVWVVIAAYNEAPVIASVIEDVRHGYPVLVIDDGSTDSTADAATGAGAIVARHPINLGQGAALQTGIELALTCGAEIIVTFDADGQHRAGDIAALVAALANSGSDFALGSRFLGPGVSMPVGRRILLRAATWFTRLSSGLRVTDAHNGLRAMTRTGALNIRLRQNRMAHASEILEQIARSGLKVVEVPVSVEYSQYSLGKGQRTSDALEILLDLFVGRLHS